MKKGFTETIDTMGKQKGEQLIKRLKKLKPQFDKLSYLEKLKFWEANNLNPVEYQLSFLEGEERNKPENYITIFPENENEYHIYFDYYFLFIKKIEPIFYDLEKMKEHYFKIINENPQAIYYTKSQIGHYIGDFDRWFSKTSYMKGFDSIALKREIKFHHSDFTFSNTQRIIDGIIGAQFIPFLEEQLLILEEEKKNPKNKSKIQLERIKWTGKPSQLGYLITKLIEKDFIELPTTHGNGSYSKLAKLFYQYFDVRNEKDEPTTEQNLIKEFNPEKNTLSETSRARIVIPEKKFM